MRLAALTLLITTLVIAAIAGQTAARPSAAASCGSDYWPLRTFSDPLRKKVNVTPKDTTLAAIASPAHPQPTPTTRNTPFELQVWRPTVQITEFKREGDSDIHLILFDAGTYGIADMPAAACVPKKARARKAIINTRKRFEAACGKATNSWKQLGAVATISGVGFWDEPHTQNRTLRTSPSYTRSRRSSSSLAAARESSSHGTPKIVARKAYGTGGQGIVSERLTQDTLRFRGCHDEPSLQRTRREEALRKINAVGLVSRAWADE